MDAVGFLLGVAAIIAAALLGAAFLIGGQYETTVSGNVIVRSNRYSGEILVCDFVECHRLIVPQPLPGGAVQSATTTGTSDSSAPTVAHPQ